MSHSIASREYREIAWGPGEAAQIREEHLAIFCTNDEMALGAVDAVQTRNTANGTNHDPVIIGVDGIPEAISTIRAGNTPFRATIVQDTRQIAEVAADTLARLRSGEAIATEIYVPASVYPG